MTFTIDDVRETMPPEVMRFLGDIASAATDLLVEPPVAESTCWRSARALLRTVATRGHAISGTSQLVSAAALAACARLVEEVATQSDLELREARERAARARRLLELLPAGVEHMREILRLELDHREEEAGWTATEWQASVEVLLAELKKEQGLVAKPSTSLDVSMPPPCPLYGDEPPTQTQGVTLPPAGSPLRVLHPPPKPSRAKTSAATPPAREGRKPVAHEPLELDFNDDPAKPDDSVQVLADDDIEVVSEAPLEAPTARPALNTAAGARAEQPASDEPLHLESGADESAGHDSATRLVSAQKSSLERELDAQPEPAFAFEDEFSFAERVDPPLAPPTATHADVLNELKAVFQQEARESVVALQGHLATFAASPENRELALPIERMYHTLKGAAATVGLGEVSARAADLQQRSEAAAVAGIDAAGLQALVNATNEMLALAGLEGISLTAPAPLPPAIGLVASKQSPAEQAIRAAFLLEAEQIHQEASTLIAALARANAGDAREVAEKLGVSFHRLKGSALVAAEEEVGAIARSLEKACRSGSLPTTAELSLGLARIASKLGLGHPRAASPPVREPAPAPESIVEEGGAVAATRAAFELEARHILDEALAHVQNPPSMSEESRAGVQQELGSLLHRLQGSARIVGAQTIADEVRALEALVSTSPSGPSVVPALLGERLLDLRARLGNASSMLGPSEIQAGPAPQRERVELTAPDELWETFTIECSELLESLERTTLALEESTSPKEHLRALMRLVHTLKGVVNTTGITPTGRTLHRVEDFLELLLGEQILPPMRAIASLLLGVQAQVRRNLKEARTGWVETCPEQLEKKLAAAMSARQKPASVAPRRPSTLASERGEAYGSVKSAGASEVSEARGAENRVIRVSTERLDALMNLAGELVVNRSRLNSRVERLQSLQPELVRGTHRLLEAVDTFREENEFANLDGRRAMALTGTDDAAGALAPASNWGGFGELELDRYEGIHVLTRRLAELTSDFAELHGQLSRGLAGLTDDSDVVGGIVTGIQTEVTHARMVPLEMLFLRLRLPLRDAATREQREVRAVVRGEDVPVDKTIADKLFQPMLHLVRNAVVHGIESPNDRTNAGKPRIGTVELAARQESGQIVIEVRDDGAGLDLPALLARGIAMGVLPPDTEVDDPRVKDMVFVSGLSTRGSAGDVAGRGVGGDIVKRTVDRLNGTIRVESTPGAGTLFAIRLPLSLAITRALIVRQANQAFAVPLHFAERIIDVHEQQIVVTGKLRRVRSNGILLPVRNLSEFLGPDAKSNGEGPVLILRLGDSSMALQVDAILAHEDIVVKNLGSLLAGHPIFGGINIRGTGELVLILDVPSLIEGRGTSLRGGVLTRGALNEQEALEQADPSPQPARKREQPAAQTRPARVLFVDDSLSVRKVAEMQLKELGVEVSVAVDGVDALAKLRERPVDLVFTDLEMPRMHGYELIRELRFLPAFRELPIVVVSSRSGQKHQDQAKELGANEYLTKPFTVQTLGAALTKWVTGASAKGVVR